MPRQTVDRLIGYRFVVNRGQVPKIAEDGQPIFERGSGAPVMEELTEIAFLDEASGHTVVVPFSAEGRNHLIEQLTGGILLVDGVGPH